MTGLACSLCLTILISRPDILNSELDYMFTLIAEIKTESSVDTEPSAFSMSPENGCLSSFLFLRGLMFLWEQTC